MTHWVFLRNLDTLKQPDMYAMQVVNFGDRPSATIALIALRKTAEMFKQELPEASNMVICNSYMDDIVDCKASYEEEHQLCKEADTILRAGGFKIKHWDVSTNATKGEQVDKKTVLGLVWNFYLDTLQFDVKTFDNISELPARTHMF